jgi:hypothetical protein
MPTPTSTVSTVTRTLFTHVPFYARLFRLRPFVNGIHLRDLLSTIPITRRIHGEFGKQSGELSVAL